MRAFLTLCSLVAVALAKPQYNYGSGVSGSLGGLGGFGGSSSGSGLSSATSFGGSSLGGSSYGSGYSDTGFHGFEPTLVHKQFISISAPEDNENLDRTKHLVIGRPQTNYRVVFIKAPSSSNANVQLSAEYAPKEEKTVIYVLSKNDNQLEVGDIATPAPTVPSKPEVFFIKYKTEQEAQHAQRQIQAEYDKIEGSSEHTDAGIAPTQSVVGIFGNAGNAGGVGNSGSFASGSGASHTFSSGVSTSDSTGYLPPSA